MNDHHDAETNYFFMIMSNLAVAKDASDVEAIADTIADLEMIAMHSDRAVVANRAGIEAERASTFLSELQSKRIGYAGVSVVVATNAPGAANLN